MSNEKQIIAKLVKLAEKQQQIINKLAQVHSGRVNVDHTTAQGLVSKVAPGVEVAQAGSHVSGTNLVIQLSTKADPKVVQKIETVLSGAAGTIKVPGAGAITSVSVNNG